MLATGLTLGDEEDLIKINQNNSSVHFMLKEILFFSEAKIKIIYYNADSHPD